MAVTDEDVHYILTHLDLAASAPFGKPEFLSAKRLPNMDDAALEVDVAPPKGTAPKARTQGQQQHRVPLRFLLRRVEQ